MTNLLRQDKHYSMEECVDFIGSCSRVYIYGAGEIAENLARAFVAAGKEWNGFVVTNNSDGKKEFLEHPLCSVDMVDWQESDGVILGVVEKNQHELEEKLNDIGCPAKIYAQRVFGREIKFPDNLLKGADKDSGFFSRFQELNQLGVEFDTDKQHTGHDYLRKYELFLQYWRDKNFTLLELGVLYGGSLATWGGHEMDNGYFTKAHVIGVDINPDCRQYVHGQEVLIKDIGNQEHLSELALLKPAVIVDDATHFCTHQIMALFTLWDSLPSGGIYIMEDIDTSFGNVGYVGYDDAVITAYDVCSAIAECVTSGATLRDEIPLREDIERIASQVDMISFIHGSCIIIKK